MAPSPTSITVSVSSFSYSVNNHIVLQHTHCICVRGVHVLYVCSRAFSFCACATGSVFDLEEEPGDCQGY